MLKKLPKPYPKPRIKWFAPASRWQCVYAGHSTFANSPKEAYAAMLYVLAELLREAQGKLRKLT